MKDQCGTRDGVKSSGFCLAPPSSKNNVWPLEDRIRSRCTLSAHFSESRGDAGGPSLTVTGVERPRPGTALDDAIVALRVVSGFYRYASEGVWIPTQMYTYFLYCWNREENPSLYLVQHFIRSLFSGWLIINFATGTALPNSDATFAPSMLSTPISRMTAVSKYRSGYIVPNRLTNWRGARPRSTQSAKRRVYCPHTSVVKTCSVRVL